MGSSPEKHRLKQDLSALYRALEAPPSTTEAKQQGKFNIRQYYSLLDDNSQRSRSPSDSETTKWAAVLETTGIPLEEYQPYNTVYKRHELIKELVEIAIKTEGPVRPSTIQTHSEISFGTFISRFGGWPKPLVTAEIIPSPDAYNPENSHKIPSEALDTELQRLTDELDRPPYSTEMDANGKYSTRTYLNRRGTWRQALNHANISTHNVGTQLPQKKLTTELQRLYKKFNKRLSKMSLRIHSQYNPETYQNRFGTLQQAYDEAEIPRTN